MKKFSFILLAALVASSAALAQKMVISAGGVTVKVDCDRIVTEGKTCTQDCAELDKHPDVSCRMEGMRVVITYGDHSLAAADDQALALVAFPGDPVDIEIERQRGTVSVQADTPVDIVAYDLRGALLGEWTGGESVELPAFGGLDLQVTSWEEAGTALDLQLHP